MNVIMLLGIKTLNLKTKENPEKVLCAKKINQEVEEYSFI